MANHLIVLDLSILLLLWTVTTVIVMIIYTQAELYLLSFGCFLFTIRVEIFKVYKFSWYSSYS